MKLMPEGRFRYDCEDDRPNDSPDMSNVSKTKENNIPKHLSGSSSSSAPRHPIQMASKREKGSRNKISTQQGSSTTSNIATMNQNRILLAVQGHRWSLELEQIRISNLINDPTFFRELKIRHKKHRSILKQILSPFRFRHCRFVKVRPPVIPSSNHLTSAVREVRRQPNHLPRRRPPRLPRLRARLRLRPPPRQKPPHRPQEICHLPIRM